MVSTLLKLIEQQTKVTLWVVSVLMMLVLGIIDHYSGIELSFAIFFLIPVSLAAWGISRRAGFMLSWASAGVWLAANLLAGEHLSHPALLYWNALTRLGFFMIVSVLLAELHRLLNRERCLARTDPLTGALNRRAFSEIAGLEIQRVQRYQHPLALLYIDLDNFKTVNDQLGHTRGDGLLAAIVQTIMANLRAIDVLARLGGDEFAILLPETNSVTVKVLAPRLQQALLKVMESQNWPVTFSIGALSCQTPPRSLEELLQAADTLMYTVKESGKNAIAYADISDIVGTKLSCDEKWQ